MKKFGLICCSLLLASCNSDKFTAVPAQSNFYFLRLTPEAASIAVGQTQQLTVTAYDAGPCGGAACNVLTPGNPITVPGVPKFTSSDPTKATVSASGVVTGVAAGTTQIIATLQDIPGQLNASLPSVTRADTTVFTVTAAATSFGGMTLSANRATTGASPTTVTSNDTLVVTFTDASGVTNGTQKAGTTTGIGATVGRPQFYSDHPEIATVGTTGIITGTKPGTATITAVITVNGVTKTATFNVTVTDPITATFSIQQAISGTSIIFFPGTLTVSATEAIAEGKPGAVVTWSVVAGTFTTTTTPNSTDCFNVTFSNPAVALATGTGSAGNITTLCSGSQSRTFVTPGTYTFTSTSTGSGGASGTLIVK